MEVFSSVDLPHLRVGEKESKIRLLQNVVFDQNYSLRKYVLHEKWLFFHFFLWKSKFRIKGIVHSSCTPDNFLDRGGTGDLEIRAFISECLGPAQWIQEVSMVGVEKLWKTPLRGYWFWMNNECARDNTMWQWATLTHTRPAYRVRSVKLAFLKEINICNA